MSENEQEARPRPRQHPPGVVLGPDGKPCRACTAFRNWKPLPTKAQAGAGANDKKGSTIIPLSTVATAGAVASGLARDGPPEGCPPDVEQLGRATWTFLHTTAAYYPDKPTPAQKAHMFGLLSALPSLYPCSWCASHLGENMKDHPPDVSGRVALSRWLCERHNDVNERLGKPAFDCSIEKTDERWKDGPSDGRCG